ncbi:MAG: hypothetical protein JST66_05270 [Bacteroidetes bacterium]|nr:hypothetical protein [Bacteroidota bacterium]
MRTLLIAAALSTGLFVSQATFASATAPVPGARHTTAQAAQAQTKKKHEHHARTAKAMKPHKAKPAGTTKAAPAAPAKK